MKIVPYKGTTVTRLNREIVEELIYERTAVEARVLRDFSPKCTPEQRALIRKRAAAYEELAHAEHPDFNRLYEATGCSTRRGSQLWARCTSGAPCRALTPTTAASGCWTP